MKKMRIIYAIQIIATILFLFLFSQTFFFALAIILLVLPWVYKILMERQIKNIQVKLEVSQHVHCGEKILLKIHVEGNQKMRFVRGISCPIEIRNYLYDRTITKQYFLEFSDFADDFETYIETPTCGKISFSLKQIQFLDLMYLFEFKKTIKQTVHTTVYPFERKVEVIFSNDIHGSEDISGGQMNRHGHDMSENNGIRTYADGDDIRAIHWKLSSKMDTWMIREAAEPFHDEIVLIPDLSLFDVNGQVEDEEINCAIGLTYSLGLELLKNNYSFCLGIVRDNGLVFDRIQNNLDLLGALNERLTIPLSNSLNAGLQYFMSEHLERNFSHLFIVNLGKTDSDMALLNGAITTCLLSVDSNISRTISTQSGSITMLQVSTNMKENVHVIC